MKVVEFIGGKLDGTVMEIPQHNRCYLVPIYDITDINNPAKMLNIILGRRYKCHVYEYDKEKNKYIYKGIE